VLFERGFDLVTDGVWRSVNEGKLWDDIKHKYAVEEDE